MAKEPFVGDRLGKRDLLFATLAGLVFSGIYLIFSPVGLDPSVWGDMASAAGLRPPQTIFPGIWRLMTRGLLSLCGTEHVAGALRIVGALTGGVCMFFTYAIVRQVLAYMTRVKSLAEWSWIAPFYALLATVALGAGDSMWHIVSPLTPGGIRFLAVLVATHIFLRWLKCVGMWRILLSMSICGAVASESPVGFLLPLVYYIAYSGTMSAVVDGEFIVEGRLQNLKFLPRWRMFFAFLLGLTVFAGLNVHTFITLGGVAATEWNPFDLGVHYIIGYYDTIREAASPIGWALAATFSGFPLIVALVLFPMLCRDNEPLRFKLGLVLFFAGVLALVQCGLLPYTRLWSFSSSAVEVRSDFLECLFALCTVLTMALGAACFTLGSQGVYDYDSDDGGFTMVDKRGPFMRHLVQIVVILCLLPSIIRIYRPGESEMRAIVHDALRETVTECGDAEFVFTDGRLDAGLEIVASQMGSKVKPLNMMSGGSAWDKYMRIRGFAEESPDRVTAETGIPSLLRVWAGEMTNGMDRAAVQLGFEFWRRARKPLPRQSGLVARETGLDEAVAARGVETAKVLAERILRVLKKYGLVSVSPALRNAISCVSWRISRFARMRDEDDLANELDESNETVKHMMRLVDYERSRTFMQMTPFEGLRLALQRADFAEARRYGATVMQIDPDDPEANFGTGMAYLMEDKLKDAEFYLERTLRKRPDEPAVLNNLSIIFRKSNRLDKALEYAKRAHEKCPENEEIAKTLRDTERAVTNRAAVLKSAFER